VVDGRVAALAENQSLSVWDVALVTVVDGRVVC